MHFSVQGPADLPPPPTADETARLFAVPLMAFIPQPSLEEQGVSTSSSSRNSGPSTLDDVSISYTLWRNPADHADAANLADLSALEREGLEAVAVGPLPDWFLAQRERMRYPLLWEAVRTTRLREPEWQTPESSLVEHVNYVVMNMYRDQRVVGAFPGDLDSPVTERHIEYGSVRIDGADVPGMRINTDPHVYAVGADLGDRILTAVVARDHLPYITVAFQTREENT